MSKIKRIFTNWRIIVLIIFLVMALVAIRPSPGAEGVMIHSIDKNSTAALAGMAKPESNAAPLSRERILTLNGKAVNSVQEYYDAVFLFRINQTVNIRTTKGTYSLLVEADTRAVQLNETEKITVEETILVNETINGTTTETETKVNKTVNVPRVIHEILGPKDIGITVTEVPFSNIRKGLDLQGGTRVVLQPAEPVSEQDIQDIKDSLGERLNVYGLADVIINDVTDISSPDQSFIVVELAGVSEEDVLNIISTQGKFEAQIAGQTVFSGGDDISWVCKGNPSCSGIDPNSNGCQLSAGGEWVCPFWFQVSLSPSAAERQAGITAGLDVEGVGANAVLSEPLDMYLDGQLVRSLNIGASLKGRAETQIAITGTGVGSSREEALEHMLAEMQTLQTVLITGSLPVKLNILKTDTISPVLGIAFIRNAWLMAALSIGAVAAVLMIAYRKLKIVIPLIVTALSEMVIILGAAAAFGNFWNIDLAAIAGIIIAIGTGVDHQIVIAEETIRGSSSGGSWKERLKRAFFFILVAYITTLAAMIPLFFAGAGLLRGFAIATIVGVSIGVFITRPAFAAISQILFE